MVSGNRMGNATQDLMRIGSLKCSPFHVRFGKFSLLRPYEKKVRQKDLHAWLAVAEDL